MPSTAHLPAIIAIGTVAVLALSSCTAASTPGAQDTAEAKHVSYLWAVGATNASFVTTGEDSYLELSGVEDVITRFSDRPDREASEVDIRDFLGRWDGRFAEVPPNAVVSYQAEEGAAPVQVVVEVSRPRYDEEASRIVFAAELIEFTPDSLDGADHPVDAPEAALPARTGPVSLFIDSEGPSVTVGEIATVDAATADVADAAFDLETALLAVQTARTKTLDDQLSAQISAISARNNRIGELNNLSKTLNEVIDSFGSGLDQGARVDDDVDARYKVAAASVGVALPAEATLAGYKVAAEDIKSLIDSESNTQMMDMLRLQNLTSKRNEGFETMSSVMKKMQDANSAILNSIN